MWVTLWSPPPSVYSKTIVCFFFITLAQQLKFCCMSVIWGGLKSRILKSNMYITMIKESSISFGMWQHFDTLGVMEHLVKLWSNYKVFHQQTPTPPLLFLFNSTAATGAWDSSTWHLCLSSINTSSHRSRHLIASIFRYWKIAEHPGATFLSGMCLCHACLFKI